MRRRPPRVLDDGVVLALSPAFGRDGLIAIVLVVIGALLAVWGGSWVVAGFGFAVGLLGVAGLVSYASGRGRVAFDRASGEVSVGRSVVGQVSDLVGIEIGERMVMAGGVPSERCSVIADFGARRLAVADGVDRASARDLGDQLGRSLHLPVTANDQS